MKLPHRVRQLFYYASADRRQPPVLPDDVLARLTEPMAIQFRILSPADQRHLLWVFRYLKMHGAEEETATAGLLHDVGKGCRKCDIGLVDRCAHVLLNRVMARPYQMFARMEAPPHRLLGLHRLANHAKRGALAARQAGYSERVSWLIEHHENGSGNTDGELQMLRRADDLAAAENDRLA